MLAAQNTRAESVQQGPVFAALQRAQTAIVRREPLAAAARLVEAQAFLEALPLATAGYAVAKNRLASATAYVIAGEWGAARYEAFLVARQLQTWNAMPTIEPRRRTVRFVPLA